MSRDTEYYLLPGEYLILGDRPIKSPPLINTSLQELGAMGWNLIIRARYVSSYHSTKIKFQFYDPEKDTGYPYLTFRMWVKGDIRNYETLIHTLLQADLTPNWTKVPSFNLIPNAKEESEIEYLKRINTERAKTLPKKKVNKELLATRVAKIIDFPVRFGMEDADSREYSLYLGKKRMVG